MTPKKYPETEKSSEVTRKSSHGRPASPILTNQRHENNFWCFWWVCCFKINHNFVLRPSNISAADDKGGNNFVYAKSYRYFLPLNLFAFLEANQTELTRWLQTWHSCSKKPNCRVMLLRAQKKNSTPARDRNRAKDPRNTLPTRHFASCSNFPNSAKSGELWNIWGLLCVWYLLAWKNANLGRSHFLPLFFTRMTVTVALSRILHRSSHCREWGKIRFFFFFLSIFFRFFLPTPEGMHSCLQPDSFLGAVNYCLQPDSFWTESLSCHLAPSGLR